MAKTSMKQRDVKRKQLSTRFAEKRKKIKEQIYDKTISIEDRMKLQLELNKMPRNSSKCRIRNRCEITGRARGYYRKFRLSRIMLRELGNAGVIPGLTKSSW